MLIFTITFLLIDIPTCILINKYSKNKPMAGVYFLCSIVFYMNILQILLIYFQKQDKFYYGSFSVQILQIILNNNQFQIDDGQIDFQQNRDNKLKIIEIILIFLTISSQIRLILHNPPEFEKQLDFLPEQFQDQEQQYFKPLFTKDNSQILNSFQSQQYQFRMKYYDHYCMWSGKEIAGYNWIYFFMFILFQSIQSIVVFVQQTEIYVQKICYLRQYIEQKEHNKLKMYQLFASSILNFDDQISLSQLIMSLSQVTFQISKLFQFYNTDQLIQFSQLKQDVSKNRVFIGRCIEDGKETYYIKLQAQPIIQFMEQSKTTDIQIRVEQDLGQGLKQYYVKVYNREDSLKLLKQVKLKCSSIQKLKYFINAKNIK